MGIKGVVTNNKAQRRLSADASRSAGSAIPIAKPTSPEDDIVGYTKARLPEKVIYTGTTTDTTAVVIDNNPESSTYGQIYVNVISANVLQKLKAKDPSISVISDSEGTRLVGVNLSLKEGNQLSLKEDGLFVNATDLSAYVTLDELDIRLAEKQDVLIAGNNITIEGNVISATNADVEERLVALEEGKQDKLIAGDNITISPENVISAAQLKDYDQLENKPTLNGVTVQGDLLSSELNIKTSDLINDEGFLTSDQVHGGTGIVVEETSEGIVISNTQTSAEWGNITGDITSQTDLIEYIDENGGKIDSISVNHVQQQIDEHKNVDIAVPTRTSDLINDGEGDVDSEGNPITYVLSDEFTDIINTKQDILTNDNAGTGIEITTDSEGKTIISNTNVSAEWGNIQGDIDDQLDLIQRLSGKQDELVPGSNIDISNNSEGSPVISVVGVQESLTHENAGTNINISTNSEGKTIISTVATVINFIDWIGE